MLAAESCQDAVQCSLFLVRDDIIDVLVVKVEHGLTSPPTQYRLSGTGRRFLPVKRPNQQYQSTEGTQRVHK